MARFKYLGEPDRPGFVITYGPCWKIITPQKAGGSRTLTPIPPQTEFVKGADIGYDITDQLSLIAFRADTRYEEIV